MKTPFLLALPLLIAAGCATGPRPYAPVGDIAYQALGADPFWTLAIGDDRIVFRSSNLDAEQSWPRVLPRTVGDVRTWQSGAGADAISIEARPGPCTGAGGRTYQDRVTIRTAGVDLSGCGGRLIRPGQD